MSKENFDKLSDEIKVALFHYAKNNITERLDIEYTDENSIGDANDQKTIKDANTLKEKAKELAVTYAQDEKFWENYEKDLPMKAALCTYYDEDVLKDYSYIIDFMRSKILPNLTETEYITNTLNYKSVNIFVYHIIKTLSFCPDLTADCAVKYATRLFTGFHNHDKMIDRIKTKRVDYIERDLSDMQLKAILPHPSIRAYAKFVCGKIIDAIQRYLKELGLSEDILTYNKIMSQFGALFDICDNQSIDWFGNTYKYNDEVFERHPEKYGYRKVDFQNIVPTEIDDDSKNSASYTRKKKCVYNILDGIILSTPNEYELDNKEIELQDFILVLQEVKKDKTAEKDNNEELKIISGEQLYDAWADYRNSDSYVNGKRITKHTKKNLTKLKCFVFPAEYPKPTKHSETIKENNVDIVNIEEAITEMSKLRKEILSTYNERKGIERVKYLWQIYDKLTNSNISFDKNKITKKNIERIDNICQNPFNYGNIKTYNHYCEICMKVLEILETSLELNDGTEYNAKITQFGEKQDKNSTLRTYYAYFNIDGILGEYKIHINNARNLSDGKIYFDDLFKVGDRIRIKYNGFDNTGYVYLTTTLLQHALKEKFFQTMSYVYLSCLSTLIVCKLGIRHYNHPSIVSVLSMVIAY